MRLQVKQLEDRSVPTAFTAATVVHLIADINAANAAGGANIIRLVAGKTFTLSAVDNTTDGATGLPVIAANDALTIVGNGDTIQRSTASGTPAFRLFDVASGALLTLKDMTVQNGLARGKASGAASAEGGAIYSQGSLALDAVTVQSNTAHGGLQGNAAGGGIYSGGSLTLDSCTIQNNLAVGHVYGTAAGTAAGGGIYSGGPLSVRNSTIQNNQAVGGVGPPGKASVIHGSGGAGGSAFGGGLYISAGAATLTNVTLSSNAARGGNGGMGGNVVGGSGSIDFGGGDGGSGLGGGLYAAGGTLDLHRVTFTGNTADGGAGGEEHPGASARFVRDGSPGKGEGGGLYIDPAATVCLDPFTHTHFSNNTASRSYPNIDGVFTICP
jgi:hypothetical protein